MKNFLKKFNHEIHGVIHGFDRKIFKGHIGSFHQKNGLYFFLSMQGIKLKDFKEYVQKVTGQIKSHVNKVVSETGAYTEYLNSAKGSKDGIAKRVAKEQGINEGLVCVLPAVGPCKALSVQYNSGNKKLKKKWLQEMSALLFLLHGQGFWANARSASNLVSIWASNLYQRQGVFKKAIG